DESLHRPFEADLPRLQLMVPGSLGHDSADQIIRQEMCPYFFAHHFRSLATQNAHLHGLFEGAEIQLRMPTHPVEVRQVAARHQVRIGQRRDYDNGLGAETRSCATQPYLAKLQSVWQGSVRGFVHPVGTLGLVPGDQLVLLAEALTPAKIDRSALMQTHDY